MAVSINTQPAVAGWRNKREENDHRNLRFLSRNLYTGIFLTCLDNLKRLGSEIVDFGTFYMSIFPKIQVLETCRRSKKEQNPTYLMTVCYRSIYHASITISAKYDALVGV